MRGVIARDCIFRIHRDVRFSRDKSPYKVNMGASIGPGGRRTHRFNYYMHLEPGDASKIAGGMYQPEAEDLRRFRAAIGHDARKFKSILGSRSFKQYFGEVTGERLTTAPQGFERTHAEIELLRLKSVVAMRPVADTQVLSKHFPAHVVRAFRAMKPFLDYLRATAG